VEAVIIIGCLLLSAFFSGMEIAYVSSNKVYLSVESKQLTLLSRILTRLTQNPIQFITAMLVGNSIALVLYGYNMGNAVMRWFALNNFGIPSFWQIIIQVAVSTGIILITAEFIPKVFFQVYANRLIKVLAIPAYFFYIVFYWVTRALIAIADFILVNVFHTRADIRQAYFTKGELGTYLNEQLTGTNDGAEEMDTEIQIFKNALGFSSLRARDIMTPRTEIAAVEISDSLESLKQLFIETDYSKIAIYHKNVDGLVGYVNSFSLFKNPVDIASVMVPIEHVPETIHIKELLDILTRRRKSMAVITDEYGGTAGIITTEDIIEQLFGEIEDEHDEDEALTETGPDNGAWLFSARLEVDYLNAQYGLALPESDSYATLGGLLVHHAGEIPQTGGHFTVANYQLIVQEASGKKIGLIKIITQPLK
jgi:putative hemolysin